MLSIDFHAGKKRSNTEINFEDVHSTEKLRTFLKIRKLNE